MKRTDEAYALRKTICPTICKPAARQAAMNWFMGLVGHLVKEFSSRGTIFSIGSALSLRRRN
jgi:hypothetical protein